MRLCLSTKHCKTIKYPKREEEKNVLTGCFRDAQLWPCLIFLQNCDTINSIILLGVAEETFNPDTQEF